MHVSRQVKMACSQYEQLTSETGHCPSLREKASEVKMHCGVAWQIHEGKNEMADCSWVVQLVVQWGS